MTMTPDGRPDVTAHLPGRVDCQALGLIKLAEHGLLDPAVMAVVVSDDEAIVRDDFVVIVVANIFPKMTAILN